MTLFNCCKLAHPNLNSHSPCAQFLTSKNDTQKKGREPTDILLALLARGLLTHTPKAHAQRSTSQANQLHPALHTDLLLALLAKVLGVFIVLQAADDARVPVGHCGAVLLDLIGARFLHGHLEVDVVAHYDLRGWHVHRQGSKAGQSRRFLHRHLATLWLVMTCGGSMCTAKAAACAQQRQQHVHSKGSSMCTDKAAACAQQRQQHVHSKGSSMCTAKAAACAQQRQRHVQRQGSSMCTAKAAACAKTRQQHVHSKGSGNKHNHRYFWSVLPPA